MVTDKAKKMTLDKTQNATKVSDTKGDKGAITFVYTRLLDTTDADEDFVIACGKEMDGEWSANSKSADHTKAPNKNGGKPFKIDDKCAVPLPKKVIVTQDPKTGKVTHIETDEVDSGAMKNIAIQGVVLAAAVTSTLY